MGSSSVIQPQRHRGHREENQEKRRLLCGLCASVVNNHASFSSFRVSHSRASSDTTATRTNDMSTLTVLHSGSSYHPVASPNQGVSTTASGTSTARPMSNDPMAHFSWNNMIEPNSRNRASGTLQSRWKSGTLIPRSHTSLMPAMRLDVSGGFFSRHSGIMPDFASRKNNLRLSALPLTSVPTGSK